MFVDVIYDFICLTEAFFSVLEMEVTTPRKDNMVALMSLEHFGVEPVNEVLHFFLSVEGAKSGIIIYEVISGVEMRGEAVSIIEDRSQYLLFVSEVFRVWPPEEVVRLVRPPGDRFTLVVSCYK